MSDMTLSSPPNTDNTLPVAVPDMPSVADWMTRLQNCPREFLLPPAQDGQGIVRISAVVNDLMRRLGGHWLSHKELDPFRGSGSDSGSAVSQSGLLIDEEDDETGKAPAIELPSGESPAINRLRLILLMSWLLADQRLTGHPDLAASARHFLTHGLDEFAEVTAARDCMADAMRREEFIRRCFRGIHLIPSGETADEASEKFAALDSVANYRRGNRAGRAAARGAEIRLIMRRHDAEEGVPLYGPE